MHTHPSLVAGSLSLVIAAVAAAGESLHSYTGISPDFGAVTAGIGDFDGDGRSDWAITSYHSVIVYSGATAAGLAVLTGLPGEGFGADIDGIGDVNLDGFADLVVGAPNHLVDFVEGGAAYVIAGGTGATLRVHLATEADEFYGRRVAGAGDVDADGYVDYLIGAPYADATVAGSNEGRAELRSGKDGTSLKVFTGTLGGVYVGSDVTGVGDVDQDGHGDFAISASREIDAFGQRVGAVRVYSGATGTATWTQYGTVVNGAFGTVIDGVGDANGDGVPDIVVGAPYANGYRGFARVLSAGNGAILHHVDGDGPNDLFGIRVAGAGDTTGDGRAEFLVAASAFPLLPPVEPAYARLYSGATGQVVRQFDAMDDNELIGAGADGVGDVDGDGLADVIIGRPRVPFSGGDPGAADVHRGCPSAVVAFGAGCAGSGGFVPKLALDHCMFPGGTTTLTIADGLGGSTALVFIGAGQSSVPLGGGCSFLVSVFLPAPVALLLSPGGPGAGGVAVPISLPSQILSSWQASLQAFVIDAASPIGVAATSGLAVAYDG